MHRDRSDSACRLLYNYVYDKHVVHRTGRLLCPVGRLLGSRSSTTATPGCTLHQRLADSLLARTRLGWAAGTVVGRCYGVSRASGYASRDAEGGSRKPHVSSVLARAVLPGRPPWLPHSGMPTRHGCYRNSSYSSITRAVSCVPLQTQGFRVREEEPSQATVTSPPGRSAIRTLAVRPPLSNAAARLLRAARGAPA